jgi:pimeloyl-ACP methyl ester carboxylesterase
MILDNQPDGVVAALAAMRERVDSASLLPGIEVPTLVLAGDQDAVIPADVPGRMASAIPRARFEIVHGAGHLSPLEKPEQTTVLVRDFLRTLA